MSPTKMMSPAVGEGKSRALLGVLAEAWGGEVGV